MMRTTNARPLVVTFLIVLFVIVHLAMGAPEMVKKSVADFHAGLPW